MTRLVIVDRHEALREGLAVLLAPAGFEVAGTAGSAAAARDLVDHAAPDLALVGVELPDASGIDLTRELLFARDDLAVVLHTGDPGPDPLLAGLAAGARGYVLKAGPARELAEALALVAEGGTHIDPRLDLVLLAGHGSAPPPLLSPREREVTQLMADGRTADAVAATLDLSTETVRTHVRNVIRKLNARNRVHAIVLALGRGEIAAREAERQ